MNFDGWCRRIDLLFRTRYPYLSTRIFKVTLHQYQIVVIEEVEDFADIVQAFNQIKYVTAPITLVNKIPDTILSELESITDKNIPSKFEGFPFSITQTYNYLTSRHPNSIISKITFEDQTQVATIEYYGDVSDDELSKIQETVDAIQSPYQVEVIKGGLEKASYSPKNEVFTIVPSQSRKDLNCPFIERDEELWFENIDDIYNGSLLRDDLFFVDSNKTSCIVNLSKFQNANLRNCLLLYDVIYCILPLAHDMPDLLKDQNLSSNEMLHLIEKGRLIILNTHPEILLDHGFLNEAFRTNPSSVVSRRAVAALCAIDLVALNSSYLFCDPEIVKHSFQLVKELSDITQKSVDSISNFLLWPQKALRASLDALNEAGPIGISQYGINNHIIENFSPEDRKKYEFDFTIHSDQVHLAHALDATYFPFFTKDGGYSDFPYALVMGNMLNFYKTTSFKNIDHTSNLHDLQNRKNTSIGLISTFDINEYISIQDFEDEISSSVIRGGMNSLFSELSLLSDTERNVRISQYNLDVRKALTDRNVKQHALDLGEDTVGLVIPFLATGKKLIESGTKKAMSKYPAIKRVSEFIEEKTQKQDQAKRTVSILTQINRVARLRGYR